MEQVLICTHCSLLLSPLLLPSLCYLTGIDWVSEWYVYAHTHAHTCTHTHHLSHNLNLVGQLRRKAISQITHCQNHRSYFLLYFYGSLAVRNHIAQDRSVIWCNFHTLQNISFKPSMKFSSKATTLYKKRLVQMRTKEYIPGKIMRRTREWQKSLSSLLYGYTDLWYFSTLC